MQNTEFDASAVQRLLRDLDAAVPQTATRIATDALEHLWLLEQMDAVDIRADTEFQRRLCRHVGMRGKLRMRREQLFAMIHELKTQPIRNYADILMQVSALTGQVEKSVASEILALFDGEQPTIDREVRELLPRYGFASLPESPLFDECVAYHRALRTWMLQVAAQAGFRRIEAMFDAQVGTAAGTMSALRKLNLVLSNSYRTVALMPNLDGVRRSAHRKVAETAEDDSPGGTGPGSPRPGVRLHLCR